MKLVGSAVIRSCVCCIDKLQRGRRIGVGRGESFHRCVSSAPEASVEVNQWPAGAARRSLVQPVVGLWQHGRGMETRCTVVGSTAATAATAAWWWWRWCQQHGGSVTELAAAASADLKLKLKCRVQSGDAKCRVRVRMLVACCMLRSLQVAVAGAAVAVAACSLQLNNGNTMRTQ